MAYKVLSPASEQLTFLCGLGWPEVTRYYLSSRHRGVWEFWEQPPGSERARMVFGWMAEGSPSESEVAKRMLGDYLGTFKAVAQPKGDIVQGLLSIKEIQRILRRHDESSEAGLLRFPIRTSSTNTPAA